eukprot:TRINITY_DN4102_c0_g1_i1.p1 TRINITY_DN4102_c0_g1~~TRINITY_DN4102_c0_g1_i1.p1  ORF type:complete len:397 (+),score=54.95 TRINITY_DN4102_c0_g1_i1:88-1191(+)
MLAQLKALVMRLVLLCIQLVVSVLGCAGWVLLAPFRLLHSNGPGHDFKLLNQKAGSKEELEESMKAFQWSVLAYEMTQENSEGWEFLDRKVKEMTCDTQGIAGVVGDTLVVGWRGTEPGSFFDILTDLKIRLVHPVEHAAEKQYHVCGSLEGKVHRGFLEAYLPAAHAGFASESGRECMDAKVQRLIQKHEHDIKRVVVTGHSLGGALATLYGVHLKKSLKKFGVCPTSVDFKVITFGSPRVGDRDFALHTNDVLTRGGVPGYEHLRWVHESDIVPRVPGAWLSGYVHTGRYLYLCDSGEVHVSEKFGSTLCTVYYFAELFENMMNLTGVVPSVQDHLTEGYGRALRVAKTAISAGSCAARDDCEFV